MPRPVISKPTGSSSNIKTKARKAVKECEVLRDQARTVREDWEAEFPEAVSALRTVHEIEDEFNEAVSKASTLVREAKESIGDFKYSEPKGPDYDPDIVMGVLIEMSNAEAGNAIKDLIQAGVIKGLAFDKKACNIFFNTSDKMAQQFADAYCEGGKEMTARVTPMKL